MENLSGVTGQFSPEAFSLDALSAELERQADVYKGLGISKDVIMGLLAPRPEHLPKELSIPVVSMGSSVDLATMESFSQISIKFNKGTILGDISGGITYPKPHLIWMHDGSSNMGLSPEDACGKRLMPPNARPATITDGLALAMIHPDITKLIWEHQINLSGTDLGRNAIPYLSTSLNNDKNTIEIAHTFTMISDPDNGTALSGN